MRNPMSTSRTFARVVCGVALGAIASVLVSCGGGSSDSSTTITKVTVIPTISSVALEGKQSFTANATDKDGNTVSGASFTWASSNSDVASIDEYGSATGKTAGTVQITATANKVTSSPASLTVTPKVGSVTLDPTIAEIKVGENKQFTAVAKDANNNTISGAVFDWAVSFSGVATIDKNGMVTGVSTGQVRVYASTGGKISPYATLSVIN